MRELLDSSTQRRLSILETLNEHGGWISSNELAKRNSASLRTINSDVNYLKDHWYPHLLIETSKKMVSDSKRNQAVMLVLSTTTS
ncbi:HTH domain-containing protein [Vagococcus acidifermentans]|uniref:Helix-turn-helix type 11 domain-containing protein n=1 Tax=Vagococcus acidifermentans TaxID=564710 RepID=A0A430AVQ1_9ENTE|nr:HTH domain-containing protein [Vagococcus acidifermentans]RSU12137.1 hypothetical protein CBF27_06840 [Vagococcus acidifermentans]